MLKAGKARVREIGIPSDVIKNITSLKYESGYKIFFNMMNT